MEFSEKKIQGSLVQITNSLKMTEAGKANMIRFARYCKKDERNELNFHKSDEFKV